MRIRISTTLQYLGRQVARAIGIYGAAPALEI
jgi:hypothetical protein